MYIATVAISLSVLNDGLVTAVIESLVAIIIRILYTHVSGIVRASACSTSGQ